MRGFTVRIEEEKAKILKAIASLEGKSVAKVLTELVDEYIKIRGELFKLCLPQVENIKPEK
jgi:hypothetical protein